MASSPPEAKKKLLSDSFLSSRRRNPLSGGTWLHCQMRQMGKGPCKKAASASVQLRFVSLTYPSLVESNWTGYGALTMSSVELAGSSNLERLSPPHKLTLLSTCGMTRQHLLLSALVCNSRRRWKTWILLKCLWHHWIS